MFGGGEGGGGCWGGAGPTPDELWGAETENELCFGRNGGRVFAVTRCWICTLKNWNDILFNGEFRVFYADCNHINIDDLLQKMISTLRNIYMVQRQPDCPEATAFLFRTTWGSGGISDGLEATVIFVQLIFFSKKSVKGWITHRSEWWHKGQFKIYGENLPETNLRPLFYSKKNLRPSLFTEKKVFAPFF